MRLSNPRAILQYENKRGPLHSSRLTVPFHNFTHLDVPSHPKNSNFLLVLYLHRYNYIVMFKEDDVKIQLPPTLTWPLNLRVT